MHNLDDQYPTRPGFQPSTSEFRATTGSNEPSGQAMEMRESKENLYLRIHSEMGTWAYACAKYEVYSSMARYSA